MTCVFLTSELDKMTYLTICEIEHLVKLDQKKTILVKMTNGF